MKICGKCLSHTEIEISPQELAEQITNEEWDMIKAIKWQYGKPLPKKEECKHEWIENKFGKFCSKCGICLEDAKPEEIEITLHEDELGHITEVKRESQPKKEKIVWDSKPQNNGTLPKKEEEYTELLGIRMSKKDAHRIIDAIFNPEPIIKLQPHPQVPSELEGEYFRENFGNALVDKINEIIKFLREGR